MNFENPPNPLRPVQPGEERPSDETANLITHGLGLALSVVASVILMRLVRGSSPVFVVACGIYCVTLIALYAASTLSHAFQDLARRRFFRMLDQMCIFLLIAGSFTPIAVLFLWEGWWPVLLGSMWVLAIGGALHILRKGYLTPPARITYGLLGWLPVISLKHLFDSAPHTLLVWIVLGGLFYSSGAIFLRFDQRVRYFHALWHIFVIAGSTCHYFAILGSAVR